MMKAKIVAWLGAALVVAITGCASKPVAIAPVGPGPAIPMGSNAGGRGFLKVFTATDARELGDNDVYYTPTPYAIFTEQGKSFQSVLNHVGDMDEAPMLVPVPAGRYWVVAQSAAYGRVRVPVVVWDGRTTVVHLNRDGGVPPKAAATDLVRLPDGEIVGWHG